tara:strand:- start:326 stop:610 length:285 start_codon:yes stop_codon:yes gene_type:complete
MLHKKISRSVVAALIISMHQSDDSFKKFSVGDIVELDNGMPPFEEAVGIGIVVGIYPDGQLEENTVLVHWQKDVWQLGRTQMMGLWEIRHANSN